VIVLCQVQSASESTQRVCESINQSKSINQSTNQITNQSTSRSVMYTGVWCKAGQSLKSLFNVKASIYRVGQKKVSHRSLHITLSNTGRFTNFFHCHILQEICNKSIIKHPSLHQKRRYTTLWNIYVIKLACSARCGNLDELSKILTHGRQQLQF